jgi:hypothetical protein
MGEDCPRCTRIFLIYKYGSRKLQHNCEDGWGCDPSGREAALKGPEFKAQYHKKNK